MAVHQNIEWASVDDLRLDPKNPRLGRPFIDSNATQGQIIEKLAAWSLDELAVSFIESGFWIQEALIAVSEDHGDGHAIYVVEGNRRLAALKLLKSAYREEPGVPANFRALAQQFQEPAGLFDHIPYIRADLRTDVSAYLGYRHVTGIKEWRPAEKAEFITYLINEEGLTYDQVRRRIGSKAPAVRQNYIAYNLLKQVGALDDELDQDKVEERFSVLYRSLNAVGTQEYLGVNLRAEPGEARNPVPEDKFANLQNYTKWVFGTAERPPLFTDSREVDKFAALLSNPAAREYLEQTENPSYEVAVEIAADDSEALLELIQEASYSIRVALGTVQRHRHDEEVQEAVRNLVVDAIALARQVPKAVEVAQKELA